MPPPALVDREAELIGLEQAWEQAAAGTPQLVVVWGRRRTGKTFLLSHFIRRKRAVFFAATAQAEAVELGRLAEAITTGLGADALTLAGGQLAGWEAALRFFAASAREEPLVVVLDEVPYLARSTPGFASVVQAVWDHLPRGARLMLVLTGSAVGVVETMLGPEGALRGRPTLRLRLDPVDMTRAAAFLPDLDPAALIEAYAACGGYPLHLLAWDQRAGVEENLERLAGTPGGVVLDDAAGILREELPETGGYARILAAVGRGRTRASEITSDAAQRIEHPLDVLVRAGFVRRTTPLGAPRRAQPRYEIADTYLAFWFSVLYSDLALVEGGQGRAVLRRRRGQWQRHLGWVFEEAARAHAARLVAGGELPEDLVVGRWWTQSGPPAEVDVLGLRGGRSWLVGEARWQDAPLGPREVRALHAVAPRLPDPVDDPAFVLWGRSGVTPEVTAAGVRGFDAADVVAP